MDAATKLAFNVPFSHAVVLINAEQAQLWVVYTLEQYAAVDTAHGTFDHDEIRLLGAAMYRDVPEVQQVSGPAACMLADALLAVLMEPDPAVRDRVSEGITSVNWRIAGVEATTVVCGRKGDRVFFGIVCSLPQLQAFQQRFFPDEPQRVSAFQSKARLPAYSDSASFILEGDDALSAIDGCHRLGYLNG